jgi:hypothetical protein
MRADLRRGGRDQTASGLACSLAAEAVSRERQLSEQVALVAGATRKAGAGRRGARRRHRPAQVRRPLAHVVRPGEGVRRHRYRRLSAELLGLHRHVRDRRAERTRSGRVPVGPAAPGPLPIRHGGHRSLDEAAVLRSADVSSSRVRCCGEIARRNVLASKISPGANAPPRLACAPRVRSTASHTSGAVTA